jgi:hypothetical protein
VKKRAKPRHRHARPTGGTWRGRCPRPRTPSPHTLGDAAGGAGAGARGGATVDDPSASVPGCRGREVSYHRQRWRDGGRGGVASARAAARVLGEASYAANARAIRGPLEMAYDPCGRLFSGYFAKSERNSPPTREVGFAGSRISRFRARFCGRRFTFERSAPENWRPYFESSEIFRAFAPRNLLFDLLSTGCGAVRSPRSLQWPRCCKLLS